MCEYCEDRIMRSCKVTVESKAYLRNLEGKLEETPCFSEIYLPINYCPICGKKVRRGVDKV